MWESELDEVGALAGDTLKAKLTRCFDLYDATQGTRHLLHFTFKGTEEQAGVRRSGR